MKRAGHLVGGHWRLLVAVLAGILALPVLNRFSLPPQTRPILAWDMGVLVFLALVALMGFGTRPDQMPRKAEAQQEGEWTVFWLTLAGIVASLAAILGAFAHSKSSAHAGALAPGWNIVLVAGTLLISWLMTHASFALRYAHEYYHPAAPKTDTHPASKALQRGLEFPGEDLPDYLDFFYFSLVLGMTFQVSDVQITARLLRRLATAHGLISFLFNTIILALSVNIAAGLV